MQAIHILAVATAALTATPSLAERALVSDSGTVYAEMAGQSASRLTTRNETILLTEACTAEIPGRGRGRWSWTLPRHDRDRRQLLGAVLGGCAASVALPLRRLNCGLRPR